MTLPTQVNNRDQVKTGPGIVLFKTCVDDATDLAAIPTLTAANGVFTNGFAGWSTLGYTDEGVTLTFGLETEDVVVNEEMYPIATSVTKQTGSAEFAVSGINEANVKLAFAGGNWSESGTGGATVKTYTPPSASDVTRVMFAFISADSDEIFMAFKCFQSGEVSMSRKKGAEKASLSGVKLNFEKPGTTVSTTPWKYHTAGTWSDDLAVLA